MRRARTIALTALAGSALAILLTGPALADASDSTQATVPDSADTRETPVPDRDRGPALDALVPEIAADPYHLDAGPRPFVHRLAVSPGYGFFGTERLFTLRAAFNPNEWLGYEATISHNPGHAVHALLHTLTAVVRHPLSGRFQPYVAGGYGMIVVFPGRALNAAAVTKNTLTVGGGLEFYIRSDLALRADLQNATVIGKQRGRDGIVAYQYTQGTVGLAFYRSIRP